MTYVTENIKYWPQLPALPSAEHVDPGDWFALDHSCRVEDGRGNLGHAATPRFPSPLIERSVRISRTALSDWLHREAHGAADMGKRSSRSRRCSP